MMCSCLLHGADCHMRIISQLFHISQLISRAFRGFVKRGKYLSMLHEATAIATLLLDTCWNQVWQDFSYLVSYCIELV